MKFKPPPADIAARLTQRSDDTEEKVRVLPPPLAPPPLLTPCRSKCVLPRTTRT